MTRAAAFLWGGTLATGALTAAFVVAGAGPLASLAAASFLILLPAAALAQPTPDFDLRTHRTQAYLSSLVILGVMGLSGLGLAGGLDRSDLWLAAPGSAAEAMLAAAALILAGLAVVYGFRYLSPVFGWTETDAVHALMPDTGREKAAFSLLSLAAGTGEEIVYRGFIPALLLPWFGGSYLAAVLPATLSFGALHAYQGVHGILRTTLMGFVLALGVAWTGSLWPSIVAHTALDLMLGLVLRDSLLGRPPANAPFMGTKTWK